MPKISVFEKFLNAYCQQNAHPAKTTKWAVLSFPFGNCSLGIVQSTKMASVIAKAKYLFSKNLITNSFNFI